MGRIIGLIKGDVMITMDEIKGLSADLLNVGSPPTGETRLSDWVSRRKDTIGFCYTSEMSRRLDLDSAYRSN